MCGIFGAFGEIRISEALNCLKKLEYRGYDSAGITYDTDNKSIKAVGRIKNLEELIEDSKTNRIICHTRWATNGKVNITNAHPQTSSNELISLVHNGVLENEQEIVDTYLKGYNFKSDTDTEKIACLLELFLKEYKPLESISKVMEIIKGSYAIIFTIKGENSIYYMKNNSSMILAKDNKNIYISSDLYALPSTVLKYIHLSNGSYGVIDSYDKIDFSNSLDYTFKTDDDISSDMMYKEITDELKIVDTLVTKVKDYKDTFSKLIKNKNKIVLIGSGSSYYAASYIQYLFEDLLQIESIAYLASEFEYKKWKYDDKTLFILISQSGETQDLISCFNTIISENVLLLTNRIPSRLSQLVPYKFNVLAGLEVGVAATKSFNQTILLVYLLLSDYLGLGFSELSSYEKNIEYFIDNYPLEIEDISKSSKVFYIGSKYDYIISLEGALKLKEISYISSWGYQERELKHGSLALVDSNTYVIGLTSNLNSYLLHSLNEVKSRGGKVLFVEPKYYSKYLGALSLATYIQLVAYYVAKDKGIDPDHPRNLAKSVTVI